MVGCFSLRAPFAFFSVCLVALFFLRWEGGQVENSELGLCRDSDTLHSGILRCCHSFQSGEVGKPQFDVFVSKEFGLEGGSRAVTDDNKLEYVAAMITHAAYGRRVGGRGAFVGRPMISVSLGQTEAQVKQFCAGVSELVCESLLAVLDPSDFQVFSRSAFFRRYGNAKDRSFECQSNLICLEPIQKTGMMFFGVAADSREWGV